MLSVYGLNLFLIIAQRQACVTSVSLCDTDGYVELENKPDNRYVCGNISGTSDVSWRMVDAVGNVFIQSTCPSPALNSQQSSCSASSLFVASSYRNASDTSILVVNATASPDPKSWANKTLICTDSVSAARCPIDYIYRARNASCNVQFNNNPWSVSGQCYIAKMYSALGRYSCRVYESSESEGARKLLTTITPLLTPQTVDGYSGNCTFRISGMPLNGHYAYTAVVVPGEAEFPFVFSGGNKIRKPIAAPSHNCPNTVREGQDIKCACSVSDYGSPSGTLQWYNTGSTQLNLTNVTRGDTGRWFACRLTWNNNDVSFVNYTLAVTYPAAIVSLTLNSLPDVNVTVNENTRVTLSCHAKGRPSPRISLINDRDQVLSSVPIGPVVTANVTEFVTYTFFEVQCQDSGNYRCEVDNDVGKDNKTVTLLVQCSPRTSASSKLPRVAFRDKEVRLPFNLTAYPTPEVVNITYLPPSGVNICSGSPVTNTYVSADCARVKGRIPFAVCTVAVHNVTSDSAGPYKLTVSNSLGQLEFLFQVETVGEGTQFGSLTTSEYSRVFWTGYGVGIGAMAALFVLLLMPGAFLLYRRNCRSVKEITSKWSANSAEDRENPELSHKPSGDSYDGLRLNEVGKKSDYLDLSNQNNDETDVYEEPEDCQ